ncbi:hypothetical protein [Aulosira sp. FACHB-615]|nr:hypothetical protein [Aulosira sp. FACHB-615]
MSLTEPYWAITYDKLQASTLQSEHKVLNLDDVGLRFAAPNLRG